MAGRWLARAVRRLGIPEDVALHLPVLHVMGSQRARVENHRGIAEYSPETVRIRTTQGMLVLRGRGLLVQELAQDDLVCVGELRAAEWIGEGETGCGLPGHGAR